MKYLTYGIMTFLSSVFLLNSCGQKTAKEYAAKFCACSINLSKAIDEVRSGNISQENFNKISKDHEECIGDDDPLKSLNDNPVKQEEFKKNFLKELEIQCPEIARNMGF